MLAKLILVAYMAVSLRSGRIEPEKKDYELTGGFSGQYGVFDTKYEKENGEYYRGLYIRTTETRVKNPKEEILKIFDGISSELTINEATNTNSQYIYKNLFNGIDILKVRLTNQWTHWKDQRIMLGAELDFSNIYGTTTRIQYDSNFFDRKILRIQVSSKIMEKKLYIEPKIIINRYNYKANDWQFKTEVGCKL
jgi:hypothetical protein